jgi:hypothetical protein
LIRRRNKAQITLTWAPILLMLPVKACCGL